MQGASLRSLEKLKPAQLARALCATCASAMQPPPALFLQPPLCHLGAGTRGRGVRTRLLALLPRALLPERAGLPCLERQRCQVQLSACGQSVGR